MARNKPVDTQELPKEPRGTKVLPNGAVYDLDKGRIVANPGGGKHAITSDTAHDMIRRRTEIKRAVVAAAANREVQDTSLYKDFGDYAWLAEGAINMQRLATSPEAGKAAVMAYESLINNAGMGERQAKEAEIAAPVVHTLEPALIALLQAIADGQREVIDVIPTRIDNEGASE